MRCLLIALAFLSSSTYSIEAKVVGVKFFTDKEYALIKFDREVVDLNPTGGNYCKPKFINDRSVLAFSMLDGGVGKEVYSLAIIALISNVSVNAVGNPNINCYEADEKYQHLDSVELI